MSHFVKIKTKIREKEYLLRALEDLRFRYEVSAREDLIVRGYRGNREKAEVLVNTGCEYDIGFQRREGCFHTVADWYEVERNSQFKQTEFIDDVGQKYSEMLTIENVVNEHNMLLREREVLPNGDIVIVAVSRGH